MLAEWWSTDNLFISEKNILFWYIIKAVVDLSWIFKKAIICLFVLLLIFSEKQFFVCFI